MPVKELTKQELSSEQGKKLGNLSGRIDGLCDKYQRYQDYDPDIVRLKQEIRTYTASLAQCRDEDVQKGLYAAIHEDKTLLENLRTRRKDEYDRALVQVLTYREDLEYTHGLWSETIASAIESANTVLPRQVVDLITG